MSHTPEVTAISVARVTFTRGRGTEDDPVRQVVAYYLPAERPGESMRLLVEVDGCAESPRPTRVSRG